MKTAEAIHAMHARLDAGYGRGEVEAMARLVMAEVMNYSPVDIVLRDQNELPDFFGPKLEQILLRLERHEPIQHILGVASFHGHRLAVTPDTLVPRPETEQLVDIIVDENRDRDDLRVLDIGTGCGCIAIALSRALRFARVQGIDVSDAALDVARGNARALKASVEFARADVTTLDPPPAASLDIVVSNPPYVCWSERLEMDRNVLDYEPATALFVPDDDPLLFYRPIARLAARSLSAGGGLYLEANRRYAGDVAALLAAEGMTECQVCKDTFGNDRFVIARSPGR